CGSAILFYEMSGSFFFIIYLQNLPYNENVEFNGLSRLGHFKWRLIVTQIIAINDLIVIGVEDWNRKTF
ncbi:hypothetical protein, partial [Nocardioides malaquae]|uniref:hypothetical protein n=1 Tax=Nocardioides malaquae TaxID=2773426 RepID=UPI001D0D1AA3